MDYTGIQVAVVGIATALLPTIYAYFKKDTLDNVLGVIGDAAPVMTTYIRRRPGGFTTEEKVELADATIKMFEEIERVSGTLIINGPTNNWIEPEGTPAPKPDPTYPAAPYRKMSEETFKFIMASLPETEAPNIRRQVDAAEAAGLRRYPLETSRRRLLIVEGMLAGDYDIWDIPAEAK